MKETSINAIHKILVPTDFSAHADEAFRVAYTLARATGAEVTVFHVARPPALVSEGGALLAASGKGATNLWDRFRDIQSGDPRVRVEHRVIVAERPSATHVLDILDELGCNLIVMGTHGHGRLRQVLFGSVTEEVVRRARCPVMVVKAPVPVQTPPAPEPAQATGKRADECC